MKEKIIALVFGLLTLILEVLISIKNPTVESITAAVFALVIVVCVIVSIRRTVTLVDDAPANGRYNGLKLANEIKPFIKEKDGKITIRIEK